jgi:DNA ligase (NAD+)
VESLSNQKVNYYFKLDEKGEMTFEALNDLKSLLEEASRLYYNTDQKILTDAEFDDLRELYESYESDPLEVGSPPPEGKGTVNIEHSFGKLVGTLGKVNTIEELKEWLLSIFEVNPNKVDYDCEDFFEEPTLNVILTQKFDGNSVVIEYKDGKVVKALTRGRNGKGVDLTHAFINKTISSKEHVGVKFEVILKYEDFDSLIELKGKSYANPRSMVSGLLGDDNVAEYADYFTLVPLWMSFKDKEITRDQEIAWIQRNFPDSLCKYQKISGSVDSVIKEIEKVYSDLTLNRSELPYMIDGLVIEIADDKMRRELGYTDSKPKWAIALKFPYMEKRSTVIGMEFDYGNTGVLTPMVLFEPVEFNGAIQKRVSLSNYKRFKELGLGIGSPIIVQYRNDTLSYVEKVYDNESANIEPIPFIAYCPFCGKELYLTENETFVFCDNESCQGRIIGRIERYLKKMDIKGIKQSTITKLFNAGLVKSIPDLYFLDYDKVSKVPGLGKKSAEVIDNALKSKMEVYDYEILGAIGIEDIGNKLARAACEKYSLDELLERIHEAITDYVYDDVTERYEKILKDILEIDGFSDIMGERLVNGLWENYNLIKELTSILAYKSIKEEMANTRDDKTFNFVITGDLQRWKRREDLIAELAMRGHRVSSGVSRKTDYLITNDTESGTTKNKKAKELGVKVINERELIKLLNL